MKAFAWWILLILLDNYKVCSLSLSKRQAKLTVTYGKFSVILNCVFKLSYTTDNRVFAQPFYVLR